MKRLQGMIAVSGLGFALSAACAMAVPPVIERMPDDALIAFAIPSPQNLQKNISALATAVDSPAPVPAVEDLLAMAGIQGGIDLTKSVGIVYLGPKDLETAKPSEIDWQAAEDRVVFLVPISNYAEFLTNFGAKAAGDGKVDTVTTPDGEEAFAKDLGGGYAAMGPSKDVITAFTGKSGDKPLKASIGKAGESLADASDFVTLINMNRLRPIAEQGLADFEKEAKQQIEAMGQTGQDKNIALVKWIGDTVVRDTEFLVGGVKFSSAGVAADMVSSFKADSYLSKVVSAKGAANALFSKLPAGPFLWAGAVDTSSPGIKQVFKDILTRVDMPGGEQVTSTYATGMEKADGQAAVIGFPLGGLMSGIFTNTVGFTSTKDPAATLAAAKASITALNGTKVEGMEGATMEGKYVEGGAKVGETSVDVWESKIKMPEGDESAMQTQQAMALLFGPQASPAGYMAKGDGGVYTTYVKSSELMAKALGASKGENLSTNDMIKETQALLPKDRFAEMYVGTKSILDLALPFAAMTGMQVPADKIPEKLPPIGASMSSDQGSLRMTIMVPAAVMKAGVAIGTAAQEAMEGAEEGMGEDAPAEKKEETGQPKF